MNPAATSVAPSWPPPAQTVDGRWNGFRFNRNVLAQIQKRYGAADAGKLLRAAAALDLGNRYLSREELGQAGEASCRESGAGYRWSGDALDAVLAANRLTEEHALLHAAIALDGGDRRLEKRELERAADLLTNVLVANDLGGAFARLHKLASHPDMKVESIGEVDGKPILAVHLPCTSSKPRLRVTVTAGVHGNEPCGPGAAVLLLEQLANNPEARAQLDVRVVTIANPIGYERGTRANGDEVDMNRSFGDDRDGPVECDALERYLTRHPCELLMDLHALQPDRNGFFGIHCGEGKELLEAAVAQLGRWPLLDGNFPPYVLSTPGVAQSDNPGTLKGYAHQSGAARWSFTLEAPKAMSYFDQVLGENQLVHHIIAEALAQVAREAGAQA